MINIHFLYKPLIGITLLLALHTHGLYAQQVEDSVNDVQVGKDTILAKGLLSQMVPTAFGKTIPKKELLASMSTVTGERLRHFNTPALSNTFFGQMAGLHVSQSAGTPGNNDNPGLFIRGRQTFQDNSVLVLVDGFETNYNTLIPDEIESVSVLKDAGALALYGMDAANGAILITTKRGVISPKTQIGFNSRFGFHQATVLPKLLGNGDYATLYNEGMLNDGKSITQGYFRSDSIVEFFNNGEQPYLYPDEQWYDEMLKPSAFSQDYSLTFSGGKSDARYFVALGYANYGGLYGNTDPERSLNTNYKLDRYNVRANFDVNITKFLSSSVNFRGTIVNKKLPNAAEGTLWRNMALFNPFPVRTPEGRWGGTQGFAANPVALVQQQGYLSNNERTVDLNVKLIGDLGRLVKGLRAFGQVNFSNFFFDSYNKTRSYAYDELSPRPDLIVPGQTPPGVIPYDKVTRGNTDQNFVITQPAGNQFNRTNLLAGFEYDHAFGASTIYGSAMYFQELYKTQGSEMPFAKQGVMGRVTYDYSKKYFAEFGYSYAGSESFAPGNRFGFFPTISAGWVLSNEDFMKGSSAISFLKLRASTGLLGNDRSGNSGRFIYNQFYVGSGTYFLGNNLGINGPMFREGNLANPDATWEKAYRTNFGVDAQLFRGLSISVDYFFENRDDIFISPAGFIPGIVGANFSNVNKGKTKSHGGEIELMYQAKTGKVEWYINVNTSLAKNEIVDIAEPARADEYLYARGNPINQPFILEAIGFFTDVNEINNSPRQLFGNVQPGDVKYKDQNGDGFIDDNDRKPIGKTTLPEWLYAFGGGLEFMGFDFAFFFQGTGGRSVSLLDNSNIIPFLNGGVKPSHWVKDNYWTPERGNNALFPRLTTEVNDNNYRASTLWQRNGSFLRLRNLEVGYTLNANILRKVKMNNLRFFANANNLFTIDKIGEMDLDPEIMNQFVHPALKSFNFGFTLKF
jgi:TonB-linked SusC/RagA family outer membrane protein